MQAAFLFKETCPNYGLLFKAIFALPAEELQNLDTYVLGGVWGLCDPSVIRGIKGASDREGMVARLYLNREGSLTAIVSQDLLKVLANETVYCAHFTSVRKRQVFAIHTGLLKCDQYCGFVQVLPDSPLHRQVFSGYGPQVKVEQDRIHVLFSGEADEWAADEKLAWVKEHYGFLSFKVEKKATDLRFTVFDANESGWQQVANSVSALGEEWGSVSEHVVEKLADIAPECHNELTSALRPLEKACLTASECRQVATNLRRCLEQLADVVSPRRSAGESKTFKDRMREYVATRLVVTSHYAGYLEAEVTELTTRLDKLWKLLDKGVHEEWMAQAIRPLVLRFILLLNELLLPIKPAASRVVVEDKLFE